MARDATNSIKTAIVRKLIADFNVNRVDGLSTKPTFIQQKPIPQVLDEPYVYVRMLNTNEIDKTKDSSSTQYNLTCMVVVKSTAVETAENVRDGITNQIVSILDVPGVDYLDISHDGFYIYRQNAVTGPRRIRDASAGAVFYEALVEVEIVATYVGIQELEPVFNQSFTYSGWQHTPSSLRLEEWDHGSISVNDSYSDSNGYEYTSSTVAKSNGHTDGSLNGRVLSVATGDENVGLTTTATFTHIDDGTTRVVTDTDNFTRIKSLRYGTISSASKPTFLDSSVADVGLRNLSDWNTGNRTIDYNNVSPIGDTFTISGDAGDYLYIVYDASQHALSSLTESNFSENILSDVFDDPVIVGGYRIYISTNAINYDSSSYIYTAG